LQVPDCGKALSRSVKRQADGIAAPFLPIGNPESNSEDLRGTGTGRRPRQISQHSHARNIHQVQGLEFGAWSLDFAFVSDAEINFVGLRGTGTGARPRQISQHSYARNTHQVQGLGFTFVSDAESNFVGLRGTRSEPWHRQISLQSQRPKYPSEPGLRV
jgi:hypothetical protein